MSRTSEYVLMAFFFQAEDGIRDKLVTGVQTCALPICRDIPVRAVRRVQGGQDELSVGPRCSSDQLFVIRQHPERHQRVHCDSRRISPREWKNYNLRWRPLLECLVQRIREVVCEPSASIASDIGAHGDYLLPWAARQSRPLRPGESRRKESRARNHWLEGGAVLLFQPGAKWAPVSDYRHWCNNSAGVTAMKPDPNGDRRGSFFLRFVAHAGGSALRSHSYFMYV